MNNQELARLAMSLEWGSDEQIAAVNELCDRWTQGNPDREAELEQATDKATSSEVIEWVVSKL